MVIKTLQSDHVRIDLMPNKSASWQQTKILILTIFVAMGAIAIAWATVGVWLILPFAGIEFSLFAFLIYRICRKTYDHQSLVIFNDRLVLEEYTGKKQLTQSLDKKNLYIEYTETKHNWRMPKVTLVNDKENISIGEFLNSADRRHLKTMFEELGIIVVRNHWWKID
ncbi:DUF2244 domain-containing protein [Agaribacter flavus]|uniref:DUF2244 domain-containing protein n=1 Tax=Agaribacter flavus TaxID=1902781 RepID=A0ABV7FX65_9ALTE